MAVVLSVSTSLPAGAGAGAGESHGVAGDGFLLLSAGAASIAAGSLVLGLVAVVGYDGGGFNGSSAGRGAFLLGSTTRETIEHCQQRGFGAQESITGCADQHLRVRVGVCGQMGSNEQIDR